MTACFPPKNRSVNGPASALSPSFTTVTSKPDAAAATPAGPKITRIAVVLQDAIQLLGSPVVGVLCVITTATTFFSPTSAVVMDPGSMTSVLPALSI